VNIRLTTITDVIGIMLPGLQELKIRIRFNTIEDDWEVRQFFSYFQEAPKMSPLIAVPALSL
jgi:hypothetical protein